ncbi:hypothetical protein M378DRAFT_163356 [Amanita muscaria Koide BX008]|uniref:Uncharacterized protein n=1 Tax=Amanita muscaria (strain Koide BX008) TaxID=946122 RepID=A0A0C2TBZ8_AMAMK|nr:hypothetical protein M378DRAFT_163356 [Amanita muscaria Koide BX008]
MSSLSSSSSSSTSFSSSSTSTQPTSTQPSPTQPSPTQPSPPGLPNGSSSSTSEANLGSSASLYRTCLVQC